MAYTDIEPEQFETLAPAFLGAMVAGSVDFINRSADTRLDRCPRLDWWAELVEQFGQIRFTKVHPPRTLNRVICWLERQVAPALAMLHSGLGAKFSGFVQTLVDNGTSRFTDWHLTVISQLVGRKLGIV